MFGLRVRTVGLLLAVGGVVASFGGAVVSSPETGRSRIGGRVREARAVAVLVAVRRYRGGRIVLSDDVEPVQQFAFMAVDVRSCDGR